MGRPRILKGNLKALPTRLGFLGVYGISEEKAANNVSSGLDSSPGGS